jgi:hypothetical protein
MAYTIAENALIGQAIAETSTTKKHELGLIVRAKDPTYGVGEFIYLLGVASTVVGSAVTWRLATYQTALAPVGTNLPERVAFAMSANVAASYGWYQISGLAVAKKALATSLAAAATVGIKTIGLVSASGTGAELLGALVSVVASANTTAAVTTVLLAIDRPQMQGRIT